MRSRRTADEQVAEVARRRLELLSAELAAIRPDPADPPSHPGPDGSGEPLSADLLPGDLPPADPPLADAPQPVGAGRHARRPVGPRTAAAAWALDRLPASLQGRVRIGPAHVAVLALVVAAGIGVSAWWAVRAADPGELVVARTVASDASPLVSSSPAPTAPPAAAAGSGAAATSGASPGGDADDGAAAEVVVDVAGKVRRPGIARLPVGSRVVDALEAAGGARPGVRLSTLNLARLLVDGEQILVGVPAVPGVAASAAAAPGTSGAASGGAAPAMVNLNTADQTQLETLPGVGPVTAQAILQWRTEHGAFGAVEELLDVSGIGEATLAELAPFVTL